MVYARVLDFAVMRAGVYPCYVKVGERAEATAAVLASIRRRCAPEPGHPLATLRVCPVCEALHWDWRKRRRRPCPRCCEIRQTDHNQQRSRKAGREYERTVIAQWLHWTSELDRLGITPPD